MDWYIGPVNSHYRCVKYFIPTNRSEIISDIVNSLPQYIPRPITKIEDYVCHSFDDLIRLLHTRKTFFPGLVANIYSTTALLQLSDILQGTKHNSNMATTQQLSGEALSRVEGLPQSNNVKWLQNNLSHARN